MNQKHKTTFFKRFKNLFALLGIFLFVTQVNAQVTVYKWAKAIGGTDFDTSNSVAVDASGNVYTTGAFSGTVDFDPGAGTANLTSSGFLDIFISKLDASGNFVWAKAIGGNGFGQSNGIAVDASGNVYTTGAFRGTLDFDPGAGTANLTSANDDFFNDPSQDIFISKLDASGNYVWAKAMGGVSGDIGYGIAVDASGNVYTTGSFSEGMNSTTVDFDPGTGTANLTVVGNVDIFISKLDTSGNYVWAKSMGSPGGEEAKSIAVDASGNVYTTGYFGNTVDFNPGAGTANLTAGNFDIFISKLDASGNYVWAKAMGGIGDDQASSIAVDASGNVYTTGYFNVTADFDPGAGTANLTSAGFRDIFISKLDASGNYVWAKAMGGVSSDIGYGIKVDASGNVYTTGHFMGTADFDPGAGTANLTSAGSLDIFISKLDASGNYVWAKKMGGTGEDIGYGIAVNASGNVYTTGYFNVTADFDPGAGTANLTSAGSSDIFISKLGPDAPPDPIASAQTFCTGATVANLVATGTNLQWYDIITGGTALVSTTVLASGTYYVTQTVDGNESDRTSVEVTVTPTTSNSTTETACTNYTWSVNGQTYTSSGIYTAAIGCANYSLDLTISAPSVAGTISGATTVSSVTNSTTLTLSGYTGSIQWQSSNALAGTYTDIGGATAATYTATNLSATTYYRAVVSNGVCSTEISSPATITVSLINPNLSKIIDSQCGATLPAINTLIRANAITGATGYRFKVVNEGSTEIIEPTSGRWFSLTSLPGGTFYNTTYTISVAVKRNNVWGEYGDACAVTTPAFPATKVQNSQCGTTLASINTLISANAVNAATGYRFKVVNGASTQTIEAVSGSRWFRLTSLPGGSFYNTTYTVSVASRYNGVWSEYGEECTVTTPVAPATKVRDSQCGSTLASLNTTISANAVSNTTGYRFKVVNGAATETIDAVSGSRWFRLTSLSGGASYNTTYTVSVATRYNGVWSEYGEACLITTPAAPLTKLQDRQCGITLNSGNTDLLYANPVSVAQKYRFEVSLGADVYTYDTASSSVRSFRMTEVPGLTLENGTTYAVRVAIMANDEWQPYGESCTITTFGDAPNFVKIMNGETTNFNVITYPNPFTENFNLNLTSLNEEKVTVMVYDMTGKLLERKEVVPSELSELQVGTNFASGVYNVIVSQGAHTKSIRVIKK